MCYICKNIVVLRTGTYSANQTLTYVPQEHFTMDFFCPDGF